MDTVIEDIEKIDIESNEFIGFGSCACGVDQNLFDMQKTYKEIVKCLNLDNTVLDNGRVSVRQSIYRTSEDATVSSVFEDIRSKLKSIGITVGNQLKYIQVMFFAPGEFTVSFEFPSVYSNSSIDETISEL